MRRILHELGFSIQYPRQKLSQGDKDLQATWLREEFRLPSKKVRQEGGVLTHEDEVVFRQSGSMYRHRAKRGVGSEGKSFPSHNSVKGMEAVAVGRNPT